MPPKPNPPAIPALTRSWPLPPAATLGSFVRSRGILLEARARLPLPVRKRLELRGAELVLGMAAGDHAAFGKAVPIIAQTLAESESLPVIPREIEDILSIKTSERHRWLKDGRLKSAGTRTVKLRGRARAITFHVFDPRHVEDLLDSDAMSVWREDDAAAAAENRRQAAAKRRLSKRAVSQPAAPPDAAAGEESDEDARRFQLAGWAAFEREGLLR